MRLLVLLVGAFAVAVLTVPVGASDTRRTGEIVFERRTGTGVAALFLVRSDGTGLRKLGNANTDFDPSWSPDGQRLVFASDRSGGSGAHELFVSRADGTGVRRLTRRRGDGTSFTADYAPAWSPDGSWIAFARTEVRARTAQSDLWLIRPDGTGLRRLTRTAGAEVSPSWASHARQLVFERGGFVYSLRVTAEGGSRGRPHRIRLGTEPTLSPRADASLLFVRDGAIYATRGAGATRVTAGSAPAWSPDGSRIVYSTALGVFSIRPDGTDRRRVTRPPALAHDLAPAWRP